MQIIEGNALASLCDYNFGDHHVVWDKNLTGEYKVANYSNAEFIVKCQEFEGKVMTLFIDNIRLYGRDLEIKGPHAQNDAAFIQYLMNTNNLLDLCARFPKNKFIIFTSHEDTPITDPIEIPDNVLAIHAVNGLSNHPKVHPFPIGLQRQIGKTDERLVMMKEVLEANIQIEPSKLLYINCGIERNPEREPLRKFETNDWCTTRFDKDSKFFPYSHYKRFLSELRNHKFVVCPKGHGFDTHRIWETLYMRRVPVMLEDPYFRRLLERFPVLFVNSWDEMKEFFEANKVFGEALYQDAQTMDMNKLDLNTLYAKSISS